MLKFNNRPNKGYTVTDENGKKKEIFESRSMATCVIAAIQTDDKDIDDYVLLVKRGPKLDHPYKWCLPCGYLDYDETLLEGALRELHEETNLIDNQATYDYVIKNKLMELIEIDDNINKNRQNVTFVYYMNLFEHLLNVNIDNISLQNLEDKDELLEVKWVKISKLEEECPEGFAFDHLQRIKKTFKSNKK